MAPLGRRCGLRQPQGGHRGVRRGAGGRGGGRAGGGGGGGPGGGGGGPDAGVGHGSIWWLPVAVGACSGSHSTATAPSAGEPCGRPTGRTLRNVKRAPRTRACP